MIIRLRFCDVFRDGEEETITRYHDGRQISGTPHWNDRDYWIVADRLGYGIDLISYTFEHEFCHSFLEERLYNRPSRILWALAHEQPVPPDFIYEEIAAQTFQGWLRTNQRPIVGDCDWAALKKEALSLLCPRVNGKNETDGRG